MNPGVRLALLGGCVLVAALVCPHSARVVAEDLLGPYASCGPAPAETARAHVVPDEIVGLEEGPRGDADGDVDPEIAHDAP